MLPASGYSVQLQAYQGPLDLLLELIERAELDITRIALAEVTDQYLAYLREIPDHHLADLAFFLLVAARLLQIKSEALLPRPPIREPGEEDPGEALARQLIAYKKYKEIAGLLSDRTHAGLRTFVRFAQPPSVPRTVDLSGIYPEDLRQAMLMVLAARVPAGPSLSSVVAPPRVNIRDQIRLIIASIRAKGRTTFRRLLRRVRTRLEIVVTFLAVLELVKQRKVSAQQEQLFGDIEILPSGEWSENQDLDFDLEFER